MIVNTRPWRWVGVALLAAGTLAGCSRPAHESWAPATAAPSAIDLATFTSRYQPVITSIAGATSSSGFTWSSAAPTQTVVSKNGLCSWRLEQRGTYAPNGVSPRDVRNNVNRALVMNGFHAAGRDRPSGAPEHGTGDDGQVMSSVDSHVALLEVTFGANPTIDVYSPAAGQSCGSSSSSPAAGSSSNTAG